MRNKSTTLRLYRSSYLFICLTLIAILVATHVTAPTKVYAAGNVYEWTKPGELDPLGGLYTSVASSADGSHLIVGSENGGGGTQGSPLYVSSNYGDTWQNVTGNADNGIQDNWQSVAISDNGQTMIAASNGGTNLDTSNGVNGNIFISHDAGSTWANISPTGPNEWRNVAISGDGSKIVAVAADDTSDVYVSDNGGTSWTTSQTTANVQFWDSISISDNGNKVLVGGENANTVSSLVDISDDGGSTWQDVSPDDGNIAFFAQAAMSSNGDEITVATVGYNVSTDNDYDAVYVSSDDGTNWTTVTPDAQDSNEWNAIALSGNGTTLSVLDDDNNTMYVSSDDGTNWTEEDPDQPYGDTNTNSWNSIAFNENGSHAFVASSANAYTGYNGSPDDNSIPLSNAETGGALVLTTPSGTNITCHSVISSSSLSTQDSLYSYPLGLVDFCFNEADESNTITLTFVTNLSPSKVVLRSYNATTRQYSTITSASITQTSYNGQPALRATYNLPDSELTDTNPEFGTVTDPVGLAVPVGLADSAVVAPPDTGYGIPNNRSFNTTDYVATITLSVGLLARQARRKITGR
jgi:hypothetical protein